MAIFDPRNYGANPNDKKDDTKAIQAALDAARDAGGGVVKLGVGTYIISGTGQASDGGLKIYSNTELSGAGMGKTIIKLADGWSGKISGMIRTPPNQVTHDVIMRNFTLDGNRDKTHGAVDGIMTGVLPGKAEYDTRILIEKVEVHDVSRIGFNPHEQTKNLTIRNCVAHHNSWDGFVADFVSDSKYENNTAYSNDRHGFNIVTHSHDMAVVNNVAYDNAENGIVVQRGTGSKSIKGWQNMLNHDILVKGNIVHDNGDNGIYFKQAENSQVLDNIIFGNKNGGIQLEGANEIIVDGNSIKSNDYGIEIREYNGDLKGAADSYKNIIINNDITSKDKAIIESGSSRDNIVAENDIGKSSIVLGKKSLLLADSSKYSHFHELDFNVSLPKNNGNNDTGSHTPPPDPSNNNGSDIGADLSGNDKDNKINGGDGHDIIRGLKGNDVLAGKEGDDQLWGNDGNDSLYGGLGINTYKGGSGTDRFVLTVDKGHVDTILDYRHHERDTLEIKDIIGFDPMDDDISTFVKLTQKGNDTIVSVDINGRTDGQNFVQIAKLINSSGFGNATDLYNDDLLHLHKAT